MAGNPLKIVLFIGSVRENRLGIRVANFMKSQLEKSNHSVEVFDPLHMEFPMLTRALHHYPDQTQAPDWLKQAGQKVKDADAYVIVTCEYNHTIPPALSNMMDHFPASSFSYKPSGIVCYSPGMYGGMRSAMHLRCLLAELGCISVSNIFGIPQVHKSIDEEGKPLNDHMAKGADRLLAQLDWMAHAMKNHRDKEGIPK